MVLERLQEFITAKKLSNSAFERKAGLSNAAIAGALNRGGALGSDKLENILNAFPELNPVWLMTGKGEMLDDTYQIIEKLRAENDVLRKMKLQNNDFAPMAELWLRFMDNQRQYNEIMELMVELYKKAK